MLPVPVCVHALVPSVLASFERLRMESSESLSGTIDAYNRQRRDCNALSVFYGEQANKDLLAKICVLTVGMDQDADVAAITWVIEAMFCCPEVIESVRCELANKYYLAGFGPPAVDGVLRILRSVDESMVYLTDLTETSGKLKQLNGRVVGMLEKGSTRRGNEYGTAFLRLVRAVTWWRKSQNQSAFNEIMGIDERLFSIERIRVIAAKILFSSAYDDLVIAGPESDVLQRLTRSLEFKEDQDVRVCLYNGFLIRGDMNGLYQTIKGGVAKAESEDIRALWQAYDIKISFPDREAARRLTEMLDRCEKANRGWWPRSEIMRLLVLIYIALDQHAKAENIVKRLEESSLGGTGDEARAWLQTKQKEYAQAEEKLRKSMQYEDRVTKAIKWGYIADARRKRGQYSEALEAVDEALSSVPGYAYAENLRQEIEWEQALVNAKGVQERW